MRTIAWRKQGSRKELIDGVKKFPVYDCTVKVIDETKTIVWIDCTCWNFVNRRVKYVGDYADRKFYAEPCKHLKLIVDALLNQGYKMKVPVAMEGPDKLTAEVKRAVIERSSGICEFPDCYEAGQTFHRNVRGSNGGKYTVENTKHLCLNHHKFVHANEFRGSKSR